MCNLRALVVAALLLHSVGALVSAQRSSQWKTLSGDAPKVVARGGFSGLFPGFSSAAFNLALITSVPDVILWCDVQLTKDGAGICFPDLLLNNNSNINEVLPQKEKTYLVNGVSTKGWFTVDYTWDGLVNISVTQGIYSRTNRFDGNLYPILLVEDVVTQFKPPGLWLNIQHDIFFSQHNLSMRNYVLSVSRQVVVNYISSPEVAFLNSIKSRVSPSVTKLVFRFLGQDDTEPSTNQTYGSLLKNLTFIKTFASGILIPKTYIWPVTNDNYLVPHTSVVLDAHKEGLTVFGSDFVNDVPLPYNYSYDPVSEYLQFVDNGDFSVDGVLSDFPITPSEAIECFAHLASNASGQAKPLVISKYGASGDFPSCTDLAYTKAIADGVDVLDCPVQISKDGIPFCASSINLIDSTTVAQSAFSNLTTVVPEIKAGSGIYTFSLAWKDIEGLTPTISNPSSKYALFRNPRFKTGGKYLTLSDFLALAKKSSSLSGVLIGIEYAAYLAEEQRLSVTDAVMNTLSKAGFDNKTALNVKIQSTNSSVLMKFKEKTSYELVYKIEENIGDTLSSTIEDIKKFADSVVINKASIFPESEAFITGVTDVFGPPSWEASPEDCDQAVQGLSTAKAAKAKKLQESQKYKAVKPMLQKVWATILGIGPALKAVASMSREDWAKKLVHWKKEFISTLQHYWLGIKLLGADIRICSRLLLKLAGGKTLSRRERQQLTRTTADIFRLVPLSVFIIVPFMEFLLPVFLKLFPNMLPSTFQDKLKEEEALKRRLKARIEYAKFLQDTAKEMAKEVQNSRSGETKQTAEDLDEFLNKVRTGARVSNEEILGFAKLFNDELTLDNISRPRLVSMCKYMNISPYGTDAYLRYMLRKRLQRIKADDKLIQEEGVESLTEDELREECRERGMLGLRSVEDMRQQLRDWLDLSLNHSMPSSLLILSRAFIVSGRLMPADAVRATLSSLPDEVVDTVGVTSLPSEDSVSERRRKLEFLEMQEEMIKEEEEKEEEELARMKESQAKEEDKALKEMIIPTAKEAQDQARARTLEKQEKLCEISRALAVLASASSVSREREEFLRLVNKEIELYNSVVDKEGTDGEKDALKAYKAARDENDSNAEAEGDDGGVSSALVDKVDSMLHKLEKEIDDVDAQIGDRWRLLDRDFDGKVTPEEVAAAANYLKNTLGKEGVQELIGNLSKDKDGKILVEDIVRLGSRSEDANSAEEEEEEEEKRV